MQMSSEISLMASSVSNLGHCTESSPFCVDYVIAQTAGTEKSSLHFILLQGRVHAVFVAIR